MYRIASIVKQKPYCLGYMSTEEDTSAKVYRRRFSLQDSLIFPSLHTLPFSLHLLQAHTAVTAKDSIWTGVGVRISISRATTMINIKFKRLMSWSAAPLYSCRWGGMFGC
ncbi:hypothetical protein QC762_116960 [Podospora pseudocomata]|uniref:Uncharacterized protein n=1 Tax=Podospora pseudocomata TaxID=2093779 RepID=A0ABR0GWQ9_9PEZI|nr:hypothetical protein QC762_116960 [Podospora pseudocomata]